MSVSLSRVTHVVRCAAAGGALCAALTGCVEQSGDSAPSEEALKAAREHILSVAPTPQFPSGAVLENAKGGKVVYLGADVDVNEVVPGQTFTVTHYYRVDKALGDGWKQFVHIATPDRRLHHNADHVPIGGKYPVALWKDGEIIRDIQKIPLPSTFTADKLALFVGFYKKNERLQVKSGRQDGQNRVIALELPVKGGAPLSAPRKLQVRRLPEGQSITIDGKLDETAWKNAVSTGPFVHTMTGEPAAQPASAKLLWDDQNLYISFEFVDTDVWGSLEKHDDKLWTEEAAEVFLDPDGDAKTYVELQVSPRNTTFDSWLPAYRQNDNAWESAMQTAVQVHGTLNQRDDRDSGWTVEMRVPMSAVKGRLEAVKGVPPQVGTEWRANFFRLDHPSGKPQTGSSWSPPLVGDFHALDKFGTLLFTDAEGKTAAAPPVVPTQAAPALGVPAKVVADPPGGPHRLNPMLEQAMKGDDAPAPAKAPEKNPAPAAKQASPKPK